jgi:hypothetical protein
MCEFTIALAGRNIRISSGFEELKHYCRNYLTDAEPDFQVAVSDKDIAFEQEKSAREQLVEGLPVIEFPAAYLASLAVYRKIAEKMLDYDTILFHGSALSVDGQGYLFTAKSGTGKSTHTRFWRETFGDRVEMINDDKPLLRMTDEGVLVCGTPWDGKHRISTNTMVPLKALCVLTRAAENTIQELPVDKAMPTLLQQSYRPATPAKMVKMLKLLEKMTEKTKLYLLGCNLDPRAAMVAYEGMNRKEIDL